jgi:hypothetical protein
MKKYLGFLAAIVGAAAMWLVQANSDGVLTDVEKIQVVISGATAASVWLAANVPGLVWAKTGVAVVLGAANFLAGTIADGVSTSDWYGLVVVVLTALGVLVAPAPVWSGHAMVARSSLTPAP